MRTSPSSSSSSASSGSAPASQTARMRLLAGVVAVLQGLFIAAALVGGGDGGVWSMIARRSRAAQWRVPAVDAAGPSASRAGGERSAPPVTTAMPFLTDLYSYRLRVDGRTWDEPHAPPARPPAEEAAATLRADRLLRATRDYAGSGPDEAALQQDEEASTRARRAAASAQTQTQPPPRGSEPLPRFCRAVAKYTPRNERELSLEEGGVVLVLDTRSEAAGWWRGRSKGREGYFPRSHVYELLPPFTVCRAWFTWRARSSRELPLRQGRPVLRFDQDHARLGWWTGYAEGRVGVFPRAFAHVCRYAGARRWVSEREDRREHAVHLSLRLAPAGAPSPPPPPVEVALSADGSAALPLHVQLLPAEGVAVFRCRGQYKTWGGRAEAVPLGGLLGGGGGVVNVTVELGQAEFRVRVDGRLLHTVQHQWVLGDWVQSVSVAGGARLVAASGTWAGGADLLASGAAVDELEALRAPPPVPPRVADPRLFGVPGGGKSKRRPPLPPPPPAARWRVPRAGPAPYEAFVAVLSRPENAAERMAARLSWLRYAPVTGGAVAWRFFVGVRAGADALMRRVRDEADAYGDVVVLDAAEGYDGIARKTAALMRFFVRRVQASYLVKVDDDALPRLPLVLERIKAADQLDRRRGDGRRELLLGHVMEHGLPDRRPGAKWHLGADEFPGEELPPFAHGPCYVLSRGLAEAVVRLLDEASPPPPYYRLEDISVGEWVRRAANASTLEVAYVSDRRFLTLACTPTMLSGHYLSPARMLSVWWRDAQWLPDICA